MCPLIAIAIDNTSLAICCCVVGVAAARASSADCSQSTPPIRIPTRARAEEHTGQCQTLHRHQMKKRPFNLQAAPGLPTTALCSACRCPCKTLHQVPIPAGPVVSTDRDLRERPRKQTQCTTTYMYHTSPLQEPRGTAHIVQSPEGRESVQTAHPHQPTPTHQSQSQIPTPTHHPHHPPSCKPSSVSLSATEQSARPR